MTVLGAGSASLLKTVKGDQLVANIPPMGFQSSNFRMKERSLFGAYAASGAVILCYATINAQKRLTLRSPFSSLSLKTYIDWEEPARSQQAGIAPK